MLFADLDSTCQTGAPFGNYATSGERYLLFYVRQAGLSFVVDQIDADFPSS
jgi:hypothetical protein